MNFAMHTIVAATVILLAGCASFNAQKVAQYSINVATVGAELADLENQINQAESRIEESYQVFTDEEWVDLLEIQEIIRGMEGQISHIINLKNNPQEFLVSIAYIDIQMEKMYKAYRLARKVFHSSRDRLTAEDVEFYLATDAKIEEAYVAYQELKSSESGTSATKVITTLLSALKLVVKVATIVGPLVVL